MGSDPAGLTPLQSLSVSAVYIALSEARRRTKIHCRTGKLCPGGRPAGSDPVHLALRCSQMTLAQSPHAPEFSRLIQFLMRVPSIRHNDTPSSGIGTGRDQDGLWWIKFGIDIEHPLAWSVVQELGHVLNY